jgi:hypothetical protein
VNLQSTEIQVLRDDINCPGDILMYNCSITSNSENLFLAWEYIVPGAAPVRVIYSSENTSDINVTTTLNNVGDVVLTHYIHSQENQSINLITDGYIESIFMVTLTRPDLYEAIVRCATDFDNVTSHIFNTSGMF